MYAVEARRLLRHIRELTTAETQLKEFCDLCIPIGSFIVETEISRQAVPPELTLTTALKLPWRFLAHTMPLGDLGVITAEGKSRQCSLAWLAGAVEKGVLQIQKQQR